MMKEDIDEIKVLIKIMKIIKIIKIMKIMKIRENERENWIISPMKIVFVLPMLKRDAKNRCYKSTL